MHDSSPRPNCCASTAGVCPSPSCIVTNENILCAHEASEAAYQTRTFSAQYALDDGQTLYISFPGTHVSEDWVIDASCDLVPLDPSFEQMQGEAHSGFMRRFLDTLGPQGSELRQVVSQAQAAGHGIIFTGHSLGGAVASLAACWALNNPDTSNPHAPLPLCITFGAPLLASSALATAIDSQWGNRFYHIVNRRDVVPRVLVAPDRDLDQVRPALRALLSKSLVAGVKNVLSGIVNGVGHAFGRQPKLVAAKRSKSLLKSHPINAQAVAVSAADTTAVSVTAVGATSVDHTHLLAASLVPVVDSDADNLWQAVMDACKALTGSAHELSLARRSFVPFGTYIIHEEGVKPAWFHSLRLDMLFWTFLSAPGPAEMHKAADIIVDEHNLSKNYALAARSIDVGALQSDSADFVAREAKTPDAFYAAYLAKILMEQNESAQVAMLQELRRLESKVDHLRQRASAEQQVTYAQHQTDLECEYEQAEADLQKLRAYLSPKHSLDWVISPTMSLGC